MGNLIKDFWTYEYKEQNYFGIIEIVKGEDLGQQRHEKKYETHIERALEYTMKNTVLSHMSIQTYCTWLKDKPSREEIEQKYYPFVLEFESRKEKEYQDVVHEVAVYVNHLVNNLGVNKEDILVMINNSKSLYVYVNPKAYAAKPEKDLHKVYFEMYRQIKEDIGLKYVDESIVTSSYKLMKTPNTYYNGGYFVWITIEELMQLLVGAVSKEDLTKKRRSLNKNIPGEISLKASKFYNSALKRVKYGHKAASSQEKTFEVACGGKCVKYLLQHMIEKGYRNYGLVSVAIYLKSLGYTKEEVKENLIQLAESWNHDENARNIEAKVNTVFRKNYKFSCKYVQAVYTDLGIENMCAKCPYKSKKTAKFKDAVSIDATIINQLWNNNASTRHYLLYLDLANKGLLNKAFSVEGEGINERTLRELRKLCSLEIEKRENGQAYVTYKASKKIYKLTKGFIEKSVKELGDYIKHYLRIFVKGYKALEKYILIRISKETLMDELGYQDISSLYKMIKRFKDIGLIKEHTNTSMFTLYYESYKVVDLHVDSKDIDVDSDTVPAAVGEQLNIKGIDEYINLGSFKIFNSSNRRKIPRGSPPTPE